MLSHSRARELRELNKTQDSFHISSLNIFRRKLCCNINIIPGTQLMAVSFLSYLSPQLIGRRSIATEQIARLITNSNVLTAVLMVITCIRIKTSS